jgi:DNA-binding NtrC family response regulator
MTNGTVTIFLVGSDSALLEGLSQSLGALGYAPRVAADLREAREIASTVLPLIVIVASSMAVDAVSEALRLPLAPGGALVLYHRLSATAPFVPAALQRVALADLTLPLERHRLVALVQHVATRAEVTGRTRRDTPGEQVAQ